MPVDRSTRRYVETLTADDEGDTVVVAGWVSDTTDLGGIGFVDLRDRTGVLQLVVKEDVAGDDFDAWLEIPRESAIAVEGTVQASEQEGGGVELLVEALDVVGEAETPLPLGVEDEVEAEMDTRLDNRFLDLRKEEVRAIFEIRDRVLASATAWLREQGFVEIHTPKIIASASEGGTELYSLEYFDREAYLAQSPQLYKQMAMGTGLDRVFEIAWYFRAEKHSTRRHLNESTAIDLEMAWIDDEGDVLDVLERLAQAIWQGVDEHCGDQLETLGVELPEVEVPFRRVPYGDVLDLLAKEGYGIEWGDDLGTEEERILGEVMAEEGHDFYFVTEWPDEIKPFYIQPDGELSRAFDLDYQGTELTSGGQRVHDPDLLAERIEAQGLDPEDFDHYLRAFRYGMPPHGGFGFGLERIVMNMLELPNIREAILFPRDRHRLTP